MSVQSRITLKTYFEQGDKPTELQFIDLLDSVRLVEDNVLLKDGNAFSAPFKIGSTDAHAVTLITANTSAIHIFNNQRVAVNSATDAGYRFDINGTLRFGTHLATSTIRGDMDFDNASNATYIKQGASITRSIKIPGTGGNAPWIFNNNASNGIQIVDSSTPANSVSIQPGNNLGVRIDVSGFNTPSVLCGIAATAASDVNIRIGNGANTYANNVGYNVKILAGAGGATGNQQGGHIYLTTGAGGGSGVAGTVIVANLRTFADNATASAAGLAIGALYIRTGHGLDAVV